MLLGRVAMGVLLVGCAHDWDKLDPRLDGGSSGDATSNGGQNNGGQNNGGQNNGGQNDGGQNNGGQNNGGQNNGGSGPCDQCPESKPYCSQSRNPTCVECLVESHCDGNLACDNNQCCVLDGNGCSEDNDCCNDKCQPSGVCGEFASCNPNGEGCDLDNDCCSDRCKKGQCEAND